MNDEMGLNVLRGHFNEQAHLAPGDRVSAELQLLLLLARGALDARIRNTLEVLVRQPINWDLIGFGAHMNMVSQLVVAHLESLGSRVPEELASQISKVRKMQTLRLLQLRAQEEVLRKNYLEKSGAAFAFIKGRHLGGVLYGSGYVRQYRDVDILIESKAIPDLVKKLLSDGYSITNTEFKNGLVPSITALARYYSAVELVGPEAIPIELHARLDNSGCVFKKNLLSGQGLVKLDDATHIAYMFYHHSRHKWSMLHWCADLSEAAGLIAAGTVNILAAGRHYGLEATIIESLKLKDDLDFVATHGTIPQRATSRFFSDTWKGICFSTAAHTEQLQHLFGDAEREPDFHYAWQRSMRYRLKAGLSRVRPTINDYLLAPQFESAPWVYWLIRPFSVAARKFAQFFQSPDANAASTRSRRQSGPE